MEPVKPTLARGTRDFSPEIMIRRQLIINTIRKTFEKYGFLPLETPAIEKLSVLTGKYGDEGDQLLFKILNSGDFLTGENKLDELIGDYNRLTQVISEKGLRYDLTVPFARYVVMNRNEIQFPFKRYQIQPVWRADRPQKGRYREFYQCDADIIGTNSLICEAEFATMVSEVFSSLGLKNYQLRINSRKVLEGIAETGGDREKSGMFFVILDKLDKIGLEKVKSELKEKGFKDDFIHNISKIIAFEGSNNEKMNYLHDLLQNSPAGRAGVAEISSMLDYVNAFGGDPDQIIFDITLARGLSYYTGIILEAKALNLQIGSIGGGGRYDNLTGVFGLPGISGVGFSFGIDRIYDVMQELNLFENNQAQHIRLMIANFDPEAEQYAVGILSKIRESDIVAEIYPDHAKLKKQLNYANKRNIPFVLLIGSEELSRKTCTLKDMSSGEQQEMELDEVIRKVSG